MRIALLLLSGGLLLGQVAAPKKTTARVPMPAGALATLSAKANEARSNGRLDEAVKLYKEGLRSNPNWAEGWYFLATIHYERDQARECVDSMGRFVKLQPQVSSGYAILGLCLYQAKDYAGSLTALTRAERLGLPRGETLTDVASYHAAILYTKDENFERAMQILNFFSNRDPIDPKVIQAMGLAALRRPIFPEEMPADDRALVYRAGRAVLTAGNRHVPEALNLLEELAQDYAQTPNVWFLYGSLLVSSDPDRGIEVLKKELAIQPNHLATRILLGVEYLKRGEPDKAIEYGEMAVKLAPGNFTGHVVLGRGLSESGADLARGVKELEEAVKLEPTSPQVRIALASAYAKAGRREEAARERAEFQKLKKLLEEPGK